MAGDGEEFEGASVRERLIHACRNNNEDELENIIDEIGDRSKVAELLNETKTVMGNHLSHEAASLGNYDVLYVLFDQWGFERDPINRVQGDTPLHTAIRWLSQHKGSERDRQVGVTIVQMMLDDGCSTRIRNKERRTPVQLAEAVDPGNSELIEMFRKSEYDQQNRGDFVDSSGATPSVLLQDAQAADQSSDDDAEFSGSDEEERAEWERRRKAKGKRV